MTLHDADFLKTCRDLAGELADAAESVTTRYFRQDIPVDSKADDSPVTRADREAEAAVRTLIEARFPEHGIIGEEHGSKNPHAEYVWVIDPIDGTKQFVTGNPGYGCLIALVERGSPLLGVIDMPMKGERWTALAGHGAFFRDRQGERPARVRRCAGLSSAILTATTPEMFAGETRRAAFDRLSSSVRFTVYGNDCYGFGLLASGFLDLVCEAELGVYDIMALAPIVTEAGGVITDWRGEPVGLDSGDSVLAAGDPVCHSAALSLIRDAA